MRTHARKLAACTLAFALAASFPVSASADEPALEVTDVADSGVDEAQQAVDSAQTTLDGAEAQMAALSSEYDALKQEADDIQQRIDQGAAQALEAQKAVIEGRASLGMAAASEYRNGGSAESLLTLLFEASDFSELVRNVTYLGKIMDYQAAEIAAQQQRTDEFNLLVESLNAQKDAHDEKLAQLEAKKAEAEQLVARASANLQGAQADQASRLAALQQKAEEMAAQGAVTQPVEVEDANTVDRTPVVPDGTAPAPDPNPEPAPTPAPDGGGSGGGDGSSGGESSGGGDSSADESATWQTGIASAYGGSTDPSTPNPGITAAGAVCDDYSMGVAVPMAWDRYWQYYGRTVEISYGGMTVLATVNDCGGMGGGSRSLDLQPGVWKAFGFSSCLDWGLRTVKYRFL